VVGIREKITHMSRWTRPQHFWMVLSCRHRLCGAHVAYARIRGVWRTRGLLPYTYVRMVSCQTEVWTFHDESDTIVIAEDEHDCGVRDVDRMDEMLETI
jgi:hypothetical protein